MNGGTTISTFQLFQMFPDAESARVYLEPRLWPEGCRCPVCGLGDRITARKGISSLQLSKEIGITQKSAWFVLHRLREACGGELSKLAGIVEVEETYIGGKNRNKHVGKQLKAGRGAVGKAAVLGLRERGGDVRAMHVSATDADTVHQAIHAKVQVGSELHTDEAAVYSGIGGLFFGHETINHGIGEYARGDVTTNGIESVFAAMKRGVVGVYHHTSHKHLSRYVQEFAFCPNEGSVKHHTLARLDSFVTAAAGKRLTYARLTAEQATKGAGRHCRRGAAVQAETKERSREEAEAQGAEGRETSIMRGPGSHVYKSLLSTTTKYRRMPKCSLN